MLIIGISIIILSVILWMSALEYYDYVFMCKNKSKRLERERRERNIIYSHFRARNDRELSVRYTDERMRKRMIKASANKKKYQALRRIAMVLFISGLSCIIYSQY